MKSPARRTLLKNARKKRLQKRGRSYALITGGAFIVLIVATLGLAYLSRLPSATIASVRVEGAEVADARAIESRAREELNGSYVFLFPRTNIVLYPKDSIVRSIEGSDTRIKSVSAARSGNELVVSIVEHTPAYLWCDTLGRNASSSEENMDERCFFTNSDGYIFAEAPHFSGTVYVTLRGPLYGEGSDPRGKRYLPSEQFSKLTQFLSSLAEQKISIRSAFAMGSGDYAVDTGEGSEIRFSITQDSAHLLDNLQSAAAVLSEKKKPEYIDLRFGNKVFYK